MGESVIEIKGRYNTAKVFTNTLESKASEQVKELCDQAFVLGSKIRIMPDTHAGAGCTIGTTMTITDKIVPNLVGVDIGCGMFVSRIEKTQIDFQRLDDVIRMLVPSGFNIRKTAHEYADSVPIEKLVCKDQMNLKRAELSIGTLGGGNHFIEMNEDEQGNHYLVVHSGSRNLGKQIADYYQKLAIEALQGDIRNALCYVEGKAFEHYLKDMGIAQAYAETNRKAIAEVIIKEMGFAVIESFTTIHNYIDLGEKILRKGAISAKTGEGVIIPINMRDGSILAVGKGNEDWNCSAPHGAGRLLSRTKAKQVLTMSSFQESMSGIFTTSVSKNTLDEAPDAYKPMAEILENIRDTVDVVKIIKPIYNFKAAEE